MMTLNKLENFIKNSLAKPAAKIIFEKSKKVLPNSFFWISSRNFINNNMRLLKKPQ